MVGGADGLLCVYDIAAERLAVSCQAHRDDVNAVAYADDSSQLIFSGSDDHLVKASRRLGRVRGGAFFTGTGALLH